MKNESSNTTDMIAGILTGFVVWAILVWLHGGIL